ncbi:MAG: hypothetical protein LQ338_007910 [Usnochroma carphineum]|nr:MAG: hypothetical protein LQ338_007910 [Usnochroma carphineum]
MDSCNHQVNLINPLQPRHVFYEDRLLVAGLTQYPTTDGHVVLECRATPKLMSLQLARFVDLLSTIRHLSWFMGSRCGLACDGGSNLSLIPLHGLSKHWEPVIHEEKVFDSSFPGYLTTKNGPKSTDSDLTATQAKILHSNPLKEPYEYSFNGDKSDQNLFACLVRGELPQWRVWEDKKHVAWLTPFSNTPGYTVLVPRKHLSSDIFSLDNEDYTDMVTAAYRVAQLLKEAFGTTRCGMFFEGFEIDYAHIKLVPVHDNGTVDGRPFTPVPGQIAFQNKYEGFLTTQFGPLCTDTEALTEKANSLRQALKDHTRLTAPESGSGSDFHSIEAA